MPTFTLNVQSNLCVRNVLISLHGVLIVYLFLFSADTYFRFVIKQLSLFLPNYGHHYSLPLHNLDMFCLFFWGGGGGKKNSTVNLHAM